MALHCRVEIRSDRIDIALSQRRLTELLAGSLDLWLADVLARIADHPISGLAVLLPWNWKNSRHIALTEPRRTASPDRPCLRYFGQRETRCCSMPLSSSRRHKSIVAGRAQLLVRLSCAASVPSPLPIGHALGRRWPIFDTLRMSDDGAHRRVFRHCVL